MPPGKRDSTRLLTEPRARMVFVLVDVVLVAMMDDAGDGLRSREEKRVNIYLFWLPFLRHLLTHSLDARRILFTASFDVVVGQQVSPA